jgi:hypothetical protein
MTAKLPGVSQFQIAHHVAGAAGWKAKNKTAVNDTLSMRSKVSEYSPRGKSN